MDSRMEVWQQCCSSMLLGSTIGKTNLKAFRISIVLADTSLSNDPTHYLRLSTCMFLPCVWTLDCMAGQVCYCSSVVAQDFGCASSDVAQEFGWAAVCQPQSSKTPITDEMLMKMDPTTGTLFYFIFFQFLNSRYVGRGQSLGKSNYSHSRATWIQFNAKEPITESY